MKLRAIGLRRRAWAFGGGLVAGSVTLLGGEPGIGRSTLLLQLASALPAERVIVYASGEESVCHQGAKLTVEPTARQLAIGSVAGIARTRTVRMALSAICSTSKS